MKLSEWRRQFANRYQEYLDELARLGVETAQQMFDMSDPELGNDGVAVTSEMENDTGFRIVASGDDAAFIEFGTGVGVTVNPTFNVQSDYPIEDGSWSRENDGPYSKNGYWFFKSPSGNKLMLYGTPAMGGMQEACIQMQNQSSDIARRVFG